MTVPGVSVTHPVTGIWQTMRHRQHGGEVSVTIRGLKEKLMSYKQTVNGSPHFIFRSVAPLATDTTVNIQKATQ